MTKRRHRLLIKGDPVKLIGPVSYVPSMFNSQIGYVIGVDMDDMHSKGRLILVNYGGVTIRVYENHLNLAEYVNSPLYKVLNP